MEGKIERAIQAIKEGKMIIVTDHPDREDEGDLLMAAEHASPEAINFMAKEGRGLICVPLTEAEGQRLNLSPMVGTNDDPLKTAFTVSVDGPRTTTGISAYDRSATVMDMVSGTVPAADFRRPGHIFPLIAKSGGVLERPGHTEAAVELAQLAGQKPMGVICEIMGDDGHMLRGASLEAFADKHGLLMISIAELKAWLRQKHQSEDALLPTKWGTFHMAAYRDPGQVKEHAMLWTGDVWSEEAPLLRIHSECLTGDAFGSLRCDCGEQLDKSMQAIVEKGSGILLYLRQEGRGIGLFNKVRAYAHQDQGLNTIEANEVLGLPVDGRSYGVAADILKARGIRKVRLITNNPLKVRGLEENGIEVVGREQTISTVYQENKAYLQTKVEKMGHDLRLEERA